MQTERPDHVFATDLPEGITEDVLKTVFSQYGTVQWCRLFAGMGKKAALLQLASPDEAAFLVENMNGAVLHELLPGPVTLQYSEGSKKKKGGGGKGRSGPYGGGAPFTQALALPQAGPGGAPRGRPGGGGSIIQFKKELQAEGILPGGRWQNDSGALHIGGLPADTTDKDVYEIFAPFGAIASKGLKAMTNPDGSCTGVAFVNFIDPDSAQAAIATLNGKACSDGKVIHVKPKRS
uniref:RRM domain-containing protein n=1 Tax=Alexandrium monilatum TaxID=311494 RepID=A0A7S4SHW2_9DINO